MHDAPFVITVINIICRLEFFETCFVFIVDQNATTSMLREVGSGGGGYIDADGG